MPLAAMEAQIQHLLLEPLTLEMAAAVGSKMQLQELHQQAALASSSSVTRCLARQYLPLPRQSHGLLPLVRSAWIILSSPAAVAVVVRAEGAVPEDFVQELP